MPSPSAPSWRKIETALIDLLRAEGYTLEETHGEAYIEITHNGEQREIHLGDFARELEKRL